MLKIDAMSVFPKTRIKRLKRINQEDLFNNSKNDFYNIINQRSETNIFQFLKGLLLSRNTEEIICDYVNVFINTHRDFFEILNFEDEIVSELSKSNPVVTKLDRFARTISQSTEIIEELLDKGVNIYILNVGVLDSSPASVLIRNVMLAFAQFEREMIIERTQEGKAIAKQKPGFREGRPQKYHEEQKNLAVELLKTNSYRKVSRMTGISVSTLVRYKNEKIH